jgi:hypothetical protein
MPDIPPEVLAAVDAALDDLPQPDSRFERDRWRIASRVALDAAAPILASREQEAVRLLEEALHIRTNGERAPGGTENWHDWDRQAEASLRSLSAPMRGDGDD